MDTVNWMADDAHGLTMARCSVAGWCAMRLAAGVPLPQECQKERSVQDSRRHVAPICGPISADFPWSGIPYTVGRFDVQAVRIVAHSTQSADKKCTWLAKHKVIGRALLPQRIEYIGSIGKPRSSSPITVIVE
jgi:hypothetical protein